MKFFVKAFYVILLNHLLYGCNNSSQEELFQKTGKGCEYAANFDLIGDKDSRTIVVRESWDSRSKTEDTLKIGDYAGIKALRVVCMSTSHIAYLSALGLENNIIGVSGSRYISNPVIKD